MRSLLLVSTLGLFACGAPDVPDGGPGLDAGVHSSDAGSGDDAGSSSDAGTPDAGGDGHGLPRRYAVDAGAAARGEALLLGGHVGGGLVPLLAMRNLWLVWGGAPPASDAAYWATFSQRYGLVPGDGGLPLGLHLTPTQDVALDCLTCHAGEVRGQLIIGAPNVRFDLQGLFDELVSLSQLAPMYGFPAAPPPWTISGRTEAAGANDAMGLGLSLAKRWAPGATIDDTQGYQRSPAW